MGKKEDGWIWWVLLGVIIASLATVWVTWRDTVPAFEEVEAQQIDLVIDPGHGGEDGGAVSLTGVPESGINLSIACKLEDLLSFYGLRCELLRREDISLHDSTAKTLREKKVSDLHNRVAVIEQTRPRLLLSIHQNSYPKPQYHGAQVFYAPTQGSEPWAVQIQEGLSRALGGGNSRQAKEIPDTVYLMNHISCPAVLVECGFLTNPEEEALLRQEAYQRKLAAALSACVLRGMTEQT